MSSAGDKRKLDALRGDALDASAVTEQKRRERKERLEAWRREQAKKRAEQGDATSGKPPKPPAAPAVGARAPRPHPARVQDGATCAAAAVGAGSSFVI